MNCSPPSSSVHGILQARTLEWVAIPFSRGSSRPREQTCVSCTAGRFFTIWATREAQIHTYLHLILQVFLAPTSFSRYYLASFLAFIEKFLKRAVDIYCFNCCLFFLSGILSNQISSLWLPYGSSQEPLLSRSLEPLTSYMASCSGSSYFLLSTSLLNKQQQQKTTS